LFHTESPVPRRKKKAHELTNDEVLKRVFRKPVLRRLKELLLEWETKKPRKSNKRKPRKHNDV